MKEIHVGGVKVSGWIIMNEKKDVVFHIPKECNISMTYAAELTDG